MAKKPRRKSRVQSRFLVIFPKGGEYQEAYATNFSQSGMYVETAYPLAEGVATEFFTNYDVLTKAVLRGRVVRHEQKNGRIRGMGVSFEKPQKSYLYDLLIKQNAFNRRYMGLAAKGMLSPALVLYRAKKALGFSRSEQ